MQVFNDIIINNYSDILYNSYKDLKNMHILIVKNNIPRFFKEAIF